MLSFVSAPVFRVAPTAVYQRAASAVNPAQQTDSFQRNHSNAGSSPSSQWQSYLNTASAHFGQKMKKGRQAQQRAEEERLNALAQAYYAYHLGDDTQKETVDAIPPADLAQVLARAEKLRNEKNTTSSSSRTVPGTGRGGNYYRYKNRNT